MDMIKSTESAEAISLVDRVTAALLDTGSQSQ